MTAPTTCENCGAPIEAGQQYCMKCGADTSGQQGGVATQHIKMSATQQVQAQLLTALREATLGEYEVFTELGRGGMATVFLAHDIQLDRKVAIKVMNPALVHGEGMVERFKLEARTAAGLSHPHIIPIYAVKQTHDLLYFVMKFIEGRPLDSIIKEAAPLPVAMVRTIMAKVGEALGYAHRRGVIHRDIKPANIMIDSEGMPIVTDFGIAKVADHQGLTMTGATIGTPTYMSPEQCNALEITGASDQYSLGIVAYEMLTGRPPFDGESVMTIMFKHVHDEPPPAEQFPADVPRDLATTISRMLAKDPKDRWHTIEESLPHVTAGTLAYDDTVRTQLVEFAKHSKQKEILRRVSTPSSPLPASRSRTSPSAETVRVAPDSTAAAAAGPTAVVAPRKSRKGLWIGLGGLAVAGAAVGVVVLGPLGGGTTPAGTGDPAQPTVAQQPPGATPTDPAGQPVGGQPGTDPAQPAADPPPQTPAPADPVRRPQQATPRAAAAVREVRITNAPGTIEVGGVVTLQAHGIDTDDRMVARAVMWTSSDPAVAQVDPMTGQLRAVGTGTARLTATLDGRRAEWTVTVSEVAVHAVTVAPQQRELSVGETVQLSALPTAADGRQLTGRPIEWTSSDPAVAGVAASGLVTAAGAGTARVTASVSGRSATSLITVTAPVDDRTLIAQTIAAYGRALEANDIGTIRQLWPSMSRDRERATRDALSAMRELAVTLNLGSVDISGDVARVSVTGRWVFKTSSGDSQNLPQNNTFEFERRGDRWIITAIR